MTFQDFKFNKKNDLRIKVMYNIGLKKNRPSSPRRGGDGPVVSGGFWFTSVEE